MEAPSPEIEEYLEMLYRFKEQGRQAKTKDIAEALGVSQPSVSEMFKKLAARGLIKHEPHRGAALERKGEEIGRKILWRHRLLERFLRFIGVRSRVHEEACLLEHAVSDEVEARISKIARAARLTDLRSREGGRVIWIGAGEKAARRLADMGITNGARIVLANSASFRGPVEVIVRGTRLAIGRGLASKILVEAER